MFKVPFLISLGLILSFTSQSQKWSVGPEFGGNLIEVSNESFGREYQLGFFGGVTIQRKFSDAFSLSSGVHFSQGKQGTATSDTSALSIFDGLGGITIPGLDLNTYTTTNSRETQHYIQIPLLASYTWKGIGLFAGPYIGIMVGSNRVDHIEKFSPGMAALDLQALGLDSLDPTGFLTSFLPEAFEDETEPENITEGLRRFDYGFKAGLSYTMDQFTIRCTYNFGVPDFRLDRGELDLQRHKFFQASISYMFPLGGKNSVSSFN